MYICVFVCVCEFFVVADKIRIIFIDRGGICYAYFHSLDQNNAKLCKLIRIRLGEIYGWRLPGLFVMQNIFFSTDIFPNYITPG